VSLLRVRIFPLPFSPFFFSPYFFVKSLFRVSSPPPATLLRRRQKMFHFNAPSVPAPSVSSNHNFAIRNITSRMQNVNFPSENENIDHVMRNAQPIPAIVVEPAVNHVRVVGKYNPAYLYEVLKDTNHSEAANLFLGWVKTTYGEERMNEIILMIFAKLVIPKKGNHPLARKFCLKLLTGDIRNAKGTNKELTSYEEFIFALSKGDGNEACRVLLEEIINREEEDEHCDTVTFPDDEEATPARRGGPPKRRRA